MVEFLLLVTKKFAVCVNDLLRVSKQTFWNTSIGGNSMNLKNLRNLNILTNSLQQNEFLYNINFIR